MTHSILKVNFKFVFEAKFEHSKIARESSIRSRFFHSLHRDYVISIVKSNVRIRNCFTIQMAPLCNTFSCCSDFHSVLPTYTSSTQITEIAAKKAVLSYLYDAAGLNQRGLNFNFLSLFSVTHKLYLSHFTAFSQGSVSLLLSKMNTNTQSSCYCFILCWAISSNFCFYDCWLSFRLVDAIPTKVFGLLKMELTRSRDHYASRE